MIDGLFKKIDGLFKFRFQNGKNETSEYPKSIEEIINLNKGKARLLTAQVSGEEGRYMVSDFNSEISRIVNMNSIECSCGIYKEFRYPCPHIICVCIFKNIDHRQFISKKYSTNYLAACYEGYINTPDITSLEASSDTPRPDYKKKIGRPKIKRIKPWTEKTKSFKNPKILKKIN